MQDFPGRLGGLVDGAWSRVALPSGVDNSVRDQMVMVQAHLPRGLTSLTDRWYHLLSHELLDDVERATMPPRRLGARRRDEFLLGRLAAKIAISEVLRAKDAAVTILDIRLEPRYQRAPRVRVNPRRLTPSDVVVSVSHRDRVAVALSSSVPRHDVGIDLERRQLSPAVLRFGLLEEERGFLATLDDSRRIEAAARLWAAKESAAKAWGTGLDGLGGPRAVSTRIVESEHGVEPGHMLSVSGLRQHDFARMHAWAATAALGAHVLAVSVNQPRASESPTRGADRP